MGGGMEDLRAYIVRLLYQHQEDALSNLDTGNNECRCGQQGSEYWRPHFADVLIRELGIQRGTSGRYILDWLR